MPRKISTTPPAAATPAATVENRKTPARALWLLSPILLLALFAVGSRLISSMSDRALPSPADTAEQQAPQKIEYVDKATQKQLEAAVGGQLTALRQHDWTKALTFANESMRREWDGKRFQGIIEKTGFAIMPFSTKQECRKALKAGSMTTMLVTVRTQKGEGAGFVYNLVHEKDGWRIAACTHALDPNIAAMPPLTGTMGLNVP